VGDDRPGSQAPARVKILLLAAVLIGVPGAVLRSSCVGGCATAEATPARVPFCSLPGPLRAKIAAGFRDGRSPDILAVSGRTAVVGSVPPSGAPSPAGVWLSTHRSPDPRIPIVLAGTGIRSNASLPAGADLRRIAPTVARALAFERPFPEVRSGRPLPGVARPERPRLVLQVVWKDVGSADLAADRDAWPTLRRLLTVGAGTLRGAVGSLPFDPAAALATIATGGLPAEHGITGTWLRDDRGDVVRAWSPGAPTSVIATIADDLDEALGQRPMVGLVGTDPADRGIVGRDWYGRADRDTVVLVPRGGDQARAARRVLSDGFGRDPVPDLLAVVASGPVSRLDGELRRIVRAAASASDGSLLIVVTATGSPEPTSSGPHLAAGDVVRALEATPVTDGRLVVAATPGGLFLDRSTLARERIAGSAAADAMRAMEASDGTSPFADAFQGFAVSFGRFC